jgi:hypothetical protein
MYRYFYRVFFICLSFLPTCYGQAIETKDPGDDLADALVQWDMECVPKGCILQTDVLRGHSDDPPDPKDFREYIGIDVPIDRQTRQPEYFAFHVDPRASQKNGIFITFSKTVPNGKSWKLNLDQGGPTRLMFDKCDEESCVVRVPKGLVEEGPDRHKMNLLDKFLESDHMLILYLKGGHAYRTMVILTSFKREYERVLNSEFTEPAR